MANELKIPKKKPVMDPLSDQIQLTPEQQKMTVKDLWESLTETSWDTAKELDLTSGSYEKNIALLSNMKKNPERYNKQKLMKETEAKKQKTQSFEQAFKAARAEYGPDKTFTFDNKPFSTNIKGEKPIVTTTQIQPQVVTTQPIVPHFNESPFDKILEQKKSDGFVEAAKNPFTYQNWLIKNAKPKPTPVSLKPPITTPQPTTTQSNESPFLTMVEKKKADTFFEAAKNPFTYQNWKIGKIPQSVFDFEKIWDSQQLAQIENEIRALGERIKSSVPKN